MTNKTCPGCGKAVTEFTRCPWCDTLYSSGEEQSSPCKSLAQNAHTLLSTTGIVIIQAFGAAILLLLSTLAAGGDGGKTGMVIVNCLNLLIIGSTSFLAWRNWSNNQIGAAFGCVLATVPTAIVMYIGLGVMTMVLGILGIHVG